MGLSSFPTSVSAGVLPILIINTALSFAGVKEMLKSVLQIVGLSSDTEPELNDPLWPYPSEGTAVPDSSGPSMAEDIRQRLHITQFCEGSSNVNECAVCISKFEDGDEIRQLPCCHSFHRTCLDKWLDQYQTTCPLCRSSLVPEETGNNVRLKDQELSDDLLLWCSAFHGVGSHGMRMEG